MFIDGVNATPPDAILIILVALPLANITSDDAFKVPVTLMI
jgi:hypothetical protein